MIEVRQSRGKMIFDTLTLDIQQKPENISFYCTITGTSLYHVLVLTPSSASIDT
jgi:hypothetical protein